MKNSSLSLNSLPIGTKGRVLSLATSGSDRRRMLDLGIVSGTTIEALQKSPSGDPIAYAILGAVIALLDEDAEKITVEALKN